MGTADGHFSDHPVLSSIAGGTHRAQLNSSITLDHRKCKAFVISSLYFPLNLMLATYGDKCVHNLNQFGLLALESVFYQM